MNFNKETAMGAALAKAMNHPLAVAMNPNRDEPTVEENAFANRNHEAKVQTMDLQLKDARMGLCKGVSLVEAFCVYTDNLIGCFPFEPDKLSMERARYLAEELVRRINNGVD